MSYTYLQEQGEVSLAGCFVDIPQYVLSRLNLIAEKSYSKDSETESYQSSQSGMMCEPLTENHGEGKLTSCAGDSLVKTCHHSQQCITGCKDWTELEVDSGWSLHESLAKYDQSLSLWKTHQISLFAELSECLEIWPKWGIMQDGECWEQTPLGLTINEIGFGLSQKESGNQLNSHTNVENVSAAETLGVLTAEIIMENVCALDQQKMMSSIQKSKAMQRELKPTLLATDYKGGTTSIRKDRGDLRMDQWRDYVKINYGLTYPHPTHSEVRMGWPTEWSALKPLEMDKFQQWLHSHGIS
jgi:hypothetical protein